METNPPAPTPETQPTLAARIGWVVLIVATLYVCYFSHLGAIGFVGPDEPRYAWIARAMAETGDWVTPRLYGQPWFEKPPLYYWGAALSFKLFGVSEAAARLPSAISALLATLALGWLALRLYGSETACWLLVLLPTTIGMIGFSHAAATDMPFSAMLTIAMVAAVIQLGIVPDPNSPRSPLSTLGHSRFITSTLFGFFLALAVLAKGPAGIILCGGAVFFWALVTKRWRDALCLLHPAGIVIFCLTALPWYIVCARRNRDFFRIFVIEHNFRRFLTPEFQHIQPFWYYGPIVLAALLPWIALLVPLIALVPRPWKTKSLSVSPMLLFISWAAFTVVFFSVSKSKLPGYILPAVPPATLVLAEACRRLGTAAAQIKLWTGILLALTILGFFGGALKLAAWNLSKLDRGVSISYQPAEMVPFLILLLGALLTLALAATRRTLPAFRIGVATIVLGLSFSFHSAILSLDELSAREFAKPQYRSGGVSVFELRRSYQYALSFYYHDELPQWTRGDREFKWVFTDLRNADDAKRQGLDCQVSDLTAVWKPIVVCENPTASVQPPR